MRAARVVITAKNEKWAREAALKFTGFATSVIACKCEAAIERELAARRDARCPARRARPALRDGHRRSRQAAHRAHRPDRAHVSDDQLLRRTAGLAGSRPRPAARCACSATSSRSAKSSAASATGACRSWKASACCRRASASQKKGVGGGNFLILGGRRRQRARRGRGGGRGDAKACPASSCRFRAASSEAAARSARAVTRSMIASTNDAYCPTLAADDRIGAGGRRELRARDRPRRPERRRHQRRDARGHSTRRAVLACARSRPATTAATSAVTTSTCGRSWRTAHVSERCRRR